MTKTVSCVLQGNVYRPNVVRIGSEEAPVSERARVVWVDGLIKDYMDMDATTWDRRCCSSSCMHVCLFLTGAEPGPVQPWMQLFATAGVAPLHVPSVCQVLEKPLS